MKQIILWLNIFLTLGILIWLYFNGKSLPKPTPASDSRALLAGNKVQTYDLQPLINTHLFGQAKTAAKALPAQVLHAPETQLNLILRGTLATDKAYYAKAVIASDENSKGQEYAVGKTLPSGAILHAIFADRVILFYNNRYETLRLIGNPVAQALIPLPSTAPTTPAQSKPTAAPTGGYRQQLLQQPDKIMDYVSFQPAYQQNRLQGYALTQGKNPELFRELGLQNGDILLAINDIYLDSADNLMQVFAQLGEARQVHLRLQRNGQITQIAYQFND